MTQTGNDRHAQAPEVLAPEAQLLGTLDPVSLGRALADVGTGLARHPSHAFQLGTWYAAGLTRAAAATVARLFGASDGGPLAPAKGDRRFTDPAWQSNPWFYGLQQRYLLLDRLLADVVEAAGLEGHSAQKARLATRMLADAVAPTNFLWSNPAALKRAFDTGGASVARGFRNFLNDVAVNGGRPRQVDRSPFALGDNMATTPGKVVFRNPLMELIQYAPQTDDVHAIPLLCSPPWINKYYIMDLAPGRSFIEWAVQHGHTVFAISYRNPDETMRQVSLDNYLVDGPRTALDVIADITGADRVNLVGLCLGGSLTVMLMAYLAAVGDDRVHSATLLNTLVDFSEPGPLGAFTDEATVAGLEHRMRRRGFLEAADMAMTFDLLRANDLIWSYVASGWLMGEDPPAFDLLAWNADSTRMPADMHSFYLRSCYLENQLARGAMELEGTQLDLGAITQDTYIVGAENDHIAPWRSSYKTVHLLKGEVCFVLTSAGHIAGIVNPPPPEQGDRAAGAGGRALSKVRHWTNDAQPTDADTWLAHASEHQGSWWEHWIDWIAARAGERQEPPQMGSDTHPAVADAPGTYVHG